jgi:hypothetical protein
MPNDTSSESWRHECECRGLVEMYRAKGSQHVKDHLAMVEKHRGKKAMERLRTDALEMLNNTHSGQAVALGRSHG